MNGLSLRCLNETAEEILNCYGTPIGTSGMFDVSGVEFSRSVLSGMPIARAYDWNLWIDDHNGKSRNYELSESQCVRVLYALTVGADVDVVRESLEDFIAKDE